MSDSGICGIEGFSFVLLEGGGGDLAVVGAGEGASFDGRKRCEERRLVVGGKEAEGASAVGGISTVGEDLETEVGAIEACTGGSEEVSVGGESDDVEDWKRWDLFCLA